MKKWKLKKLTEKELLERLEEWRNVAKIELANLWTKKDDRVYKRIVEFIKIFFAKEISSGPIKEDISRLVLIEWLQGINQAATAVHDDYVMKATTQLIEMLEEPDDDEFFEKRVAEYERGLKDAKALELPEITEAWTDAKAKEIKALIQDAQDEDLDDPVMSLHYLGLALDIVDSIINDLRPK